MSSTGPDAVSADVDVGSASSPLLRTLRAATPIGSRVDVEEPERPVADEAGLGNAGDQSPPTAGSLSSMPWSGREHRGRSRGCRDARGRGTSDAAVGVRMDARRSQVGSASWNAESVNAKLTPGTSAAGSVSEAPVDDADRLLGAWWSTRTGRGPDRPHEHLGATWGARPSAERGSPPSAPKRIRSKVSTPLPWSAGSLTGAVKQRAGPAAEGVVDTVGSGDRESIRSPTSRARVGDHLLAPVAVPPGVAGSRGGRGADR